MAWSNRNQTIKDLTGIEDADFKEQLAAGKIAAQKVADVKTELGTLSTNTQTQFDEIKKTLEGISTRLTPQQTGNEGGNGGNGGNGSGGGYELPAWNDDPDAAFDARLNPKLNQLLLGQINTNVDIAMQAMKDKHGNMFNSLKDELMSELKLKGAGYVAQHKDKEGKFDGAFGAVQEAFDLIKGRHMDEIINDRDKRSGRFYVESGSSAAGGTNTGNPKTTDGTLTLTDEEKAFAKRMNMSEESLLKGKEKMSRLEKGEYI